MSLPPRHGNGENSASLWYLVPSSLTEQQSQASFPSWLWHHRYKPTLTTLILSDAFQKIRPQVAMLHRPSSLFATAH